MNKPCQNCGVEFYTTHPIKIFCSKQCKHRKITRESAARKRNGVLDYMPKKQESILFVDKTNGGDIIKYPNPIYSDKTMDLSILPVSFSSKIKINADTNCYIWIGYKMYEYGEYNHKRAHRFSWEQHNGVIPNGLFVDHICKNKLCVNIKHLRLVVPAINNTENSNSFSARFKIRTHCKNGHEYTGNNYYIDTRGGNGRICRICQRMYRDRKRKSLRMAI
jgi:hypothetical protein